MPPRGFRHSCAKLSKRWPPATKLIFVLAFVSANRTPKPKGQTKWPSIAVSTTEEVINKLSGKGWQVAKTPKS